MSLLLAPVPGGGVSMAPIFIITAGLSDALKALDKAKPTRRRVSKATTKD